MAIPVWRRAFTLLELLLVIAIIGVLIGLTLPAVQRVRDASLRITCTSHLRQIGLALHNYHDVFSVFPPGVTGPGTRGTYSFLGWEARILPFIEQDNLWLTVPSAYLQAPYPFDNPPHVGLDTVIRLYVCPSDPRVQQAQISRGWHVAFTSYLGVEGIDFKTTNGVLYMNSAIAFADVSDGTSNTLLVGERPPSADLYYGWWYAGEGQASTGTTDMMLGVREQMAESIPGCPPGPYTYAPGRFNNQCDMFHFWSPHFGGAHFLMVDGSVHFLPYSAASLMPALATRNGGESVSLPD